MVEKLKMNGSQLSIHGTNKQTAFAKEIIEALPLTGNEASDRLLIQEAIDKEKIAANILYEGNTVYGYIKLVKEFKKIIATDDLSSMTNDLYKFLHLNFDIAHYDKAGYIAYYYGSFSNCYKQTLQRAFQRGHGRFTDHERIANAVERLVRGEKVEDLLIENKSIKKVAQNKELAKKGVKKVPLISPNVVTGQTDLFSLMGIA